MKEKDRQALTEFLGLCWHEFKGDFGPYNTACVKCQMVFDAIHSSDWNLTAFNRTFTTWQDLGDVFERLVRGGKDLRFQQYARPMFERETYNKGRLIDFTAWLFRPIDEKGEPHFCRLVVEFLEVKP